MVYLLHFAPPYHGIRHYAGATSDPELSLALDRGDASRLQLPIVVSAREHGVDVIVTRTWSSVYSRVDELPYRNDRRKLCPRCVAVDGLRRRA